MGSVCFVEREVALFIVVTSSYPKMGNAYGHVVHAYLHPDQAPDWTQPPTFNPNMGFENGRKPRVMVATQEELNQHNIPLDKRDYCAHHYINWMSCRKQVYPFTGRCHHEKHVYDQCEFDDWVLRMKEYERE